MRTILEVHGEPTVLADRMRTATPEAASVVGDAWIPVLDDLTGIVCEHVVEFFTTRETFDAAANLELLKRGARSYEPEEERELLADYTRLVREKSQRIRLFGLDLHEDDQTYDLMTGFVDLTIETSYRRRQDQTFRDELPAERVSWNRLDALLHQRRWILLEGPAGSGKSTLAQWLTLNLLVGEPPSHSPVPFLIRLREFAGGQALNLPQPEDFVRTLAPPLAGRLPDWETQLLRNGTAAVVIDGLDEIPEQFRDAACDWLHDLVITYPSAYVVVTTRPAGLADSWRQRLIGGLSFTQAAINPMSTEQVSRFIDRWHEAAADRPHADPAELQECATSLKQAIRTRRDLSRITTTPLLCAMVCALYRADNQVLPRNRTALYERACAMLLEKRDTQQKIQTFPVPLTREQIEPFLTEIALWMLLNKQRSIPRKNALESVADILPRLQVTDPPKPWKPTAEELLRHLIVRSGVLQEPTMELVEFVHPSFQDFLAAKRIFQKSYMPHLIENAHDAMYQDVAVMAVSQVQGDRDRQNELLKGLIDRAKSDRKHSRQLYLLAAACIADATMVDPKWVRLVRTKTRSLLPPQSLREAQVLAAAGEFTLDLLANAEQSRRFSLAEAEATVMAISLMNGGGDVGIRILRALAERFGSWIGFELIRAWHQTQDPRAFRDEVLAYCDFEGVPVPIDSAHLLDFLDGLPGLDRVLLGAETAQQPPALDLIGLAVTAMHVRALPDYPRLRHLELDQAPAAALRGIERFPSLDGVTIRDLVEPEVADLIALPRLTSLTIDGAKKLNLAPLASIPTLTRLTLSASEAIDLTPLADLWSLYDLSIGEAPITSEKPLPHVASLDIADLHDGSEGLFPGLTSIRADRMTLDHAALAEMPRLTKLYLRGTDIANLESLVVIPHLDRLELRMSNSDKAAGLADLHIKEITLSGSASLSPLEQTPMLQTLKLHGVPGRILAKLPASPMLRTVELWNVSQLDLAKLRTSAEISRLSLIMAHDSDLGGLTAMPSLTHLELSNTHTFDVEPLRKLTHLGDLKVHHVKHFDRSALRYLTGLKRLQLDGHFPINPTWLPPNAELTLLNLSRLTPTDLAALPTLRALILSETPHCGLAALAIVPTIERLALNQIAGFRTTDLADWPVLRSLTLTNMPGVDFEALTALPNLRELELHQMACTGISVLPWLEAVGLGRTKLDLAELTSLPKLRRLTLTQRPESDLSILATLPSLTELELVNMPWADLTPFQARPDIKITQR